MKALRVQVDNPTLLTLMGAVLGLVVRMCLPEFSWWAFFFGMFCISFMLTFQADQKEVTRTAFYAAGVSAFLAVSGWLSALLLNEPNIGEYASRFSKSGGSLGGVFYGAIVFIISAAFFMAYSKKGYWNADYKLLDQYAWGRPLIYVGSWVFVLLVWIILGIWIGLFTVLGISIFKTIFLQPWFVATSIGGAFSLGALILVRQEGIIGSSRALCENLFSVLAPLLALLILLFLAILPITGLDAIWDTGNTNALIASLIVMGILVINAIIRCEGEVTSKLYSLCARLLALTMPVLAVIAYWALAVRVGAYGLTPRRIDAIILMGVASLYAITYAVAAFSCWKTGWENRIRQINVINALVVLVVAAVMVTPIINLRAISAWQQKNALLSGRIAVEHFDFAAMKYRLGKSGVNALEDIRAAAATHPQRALLLAKLNDVTQSENYYEAARKQNDEDVSLKPGEDISAIYVITPANALMTPEMVNALSRQSYEFKECRKLMADGPKSQKRCVLTLVDAYGDQGKEILVMGPHGISRMLYRKENGTWGQMSVTLRIPTVKERPAANEAVRAALLAGLVKAIPTDYKMLNAGGVILQITPENP